MGVWVLAILLLAGCAGKEAHNDTYTCPMHPTVVSDKPASCPVCGMDLVRKARAGEEVEITEELAQLLQSPNETIVSSIATVKGTYQSLPGEQQVQGIITYDTRNASTLSARIAGRLDKVFIKSLYQPVTKGQKIAAIYSPELITAQRELLYLLEHDATNSSLIEAARQKLGLLGFTSSQTDELIRRKEVQGTAIIYSTQDGYITGAKQSTPALAAATSGMGSSMSTAPAATVASSESGLLREGDYVSAGQTLFTVINTSALRIELNLPSTQAAFIQLHDEVDLRIEGKTIKTSVDFIAPFTEGDELIRIRLYLSNNDQFRIGQLVSATLKSKASETLWVPNAAVLDMGTRQIVFVKDHGVFKPREIKTGKRTAAWTEVKGLASSEEIASDAHYMVDSEDLIKPIR